MHTENRREGSMTEAYAGDSVNLFMHVHGIHSVFPVSVLSVTNSWLKKIRALEEQGEEVMLPLNGF